MNRGRIVTKQDLKHISTFEELLEISKANGYDRNWASKKAKALGILNPRAKVKNDVRILDNGYHNKANEHSELLESLQTQIELLITENTKLKQELMIANEIQKLKNERGAGRKPKLNDGLIAKVKELRGKGASHKTIASELGISVGLAHKASQS